MSKPLINFADLRDDYQLLTRRFRKLEAENAELREMLDRRHEMAAELVQVGDALAEQLTRSNEQREELLQLVDQMSNQVYEQAKRQYERAEKPSPPGVDTVHT